MPRKYTGQTREIFVERKRPNGDIYVFKRIVQYDRETKKMKILSETLVGIKDPKTGEIRKTRHRRTKEEMQEIKEAKRVHVGMTDILEWAGKSSGIDADVKKCMADDPDTALKIISLARYLVVSDHNTLAAFENWQLNHVIPYDDFISESTYHNLFEALGQDETFCQQYFKTRASHLKKGDSIAYDSTTISTYSKNQIEARQGFNKDGDGLNTIKLLLLYSVENHQPIAFAKQPGNIPDVISIENTLKQFEVLDVKRPQLVTDKGYYSEDNILDLVRSHMDFITACPDNVKWIKDSFIDKVDSLHSAATVCPFDQNEIHGFTVRVMHEFSWERQHSSKTKKKGEIESKSFRLYLHVFRSESKAQQECINEYNRLNELKSQILSGETEFTESAQRTIKKALIIHRRKEQIVSVDFNTRYLDEKAKTYGIFTIMTNHEKDCFKVLKKYRKRNRIEDCFKLDKEFVDGSRPRVWTSDVLRGRMMVQFIALGYLSFLYARIREVKDTLGKPNGDEEHDTKQRLSAEKSLLSWMENHSLQQQLSYFDCIEETTVNTAAKKIRWTTEHIKRDRLYLQSLGVIK